METALLKWENEAEQEYQVSDLLMDVERAEFLVWDVGSIQVLIVKSIFSSRWDPICRQS